MPKLFVDEGNLSSIVPLLIENIVAIAQYLLIFHSVSVPQLRIPFTIIRTK